ncbi:hypothetical protein E2562_003049 [Oryza meyeriana var. granulata]|uniref:Uncharacterized protein n=1 Tax=Oryza meyeriana var. granulata TaxID=110450 RepID=A0A6G1DDP4_9ORYZ|nr:hypothetical protein E2562_003049 [Oryza meyeriana var. granulata]
MPLAVPTCRAIRRCRRPPPSQAVIFAAHQTTAATLRLDWSSGAPDLAKRLQIQPPTLLAGSKEGRHQFARIRGRHDSHQARVWPRTRKIHVASSSTAVVSISATT